MSLQPSEKARDYTRTQLGCDVRVGQNAGSRLSLYTLCADTVFGLVIKEKEHLESGGTNQGGDAKRGEILRKITCQEFRHDQSDSACAGNWSTCSHRENIFSESFFVFFVVFLF